MTTCATCKGRGWLKWPDGIYMTPFGFVPNLINLLCPACQGGGET